jgi:hypothetical protein
VIRVTDKKAAWLVTMAWKYVPKHLWKTIGRRGGPDKWQNNSHT